MAPKEESQRERITRLVQDIIMDKTVCRKIVNNMSSNGKDFDRFEDMSDDEIAEMIEMEAEEFDD